MSVSHHQSPEEQDASNRLLDQFLNRAKPEHPAGHIRAGDQGALAFAVAVDRDKEVVIIRFGKPVDWLGLRKSEVLHLATLLQEKAAQLS